MSGLRWVKSLNSSEQVAFLFVMLFGALMLTSIGSFLVSLKKRAQDEDDGEWHRGWSRFRQELNVLWLFASLFWAAWISGPVGATLLFSVFSFLALREFITLMHTRRGDHRSLILAFFV
ncbi:MAG TPA: phosphatidate cytidylyltransferase, partial [Burkholderiaceae bacterium]|nr:phosphatidate cytidylyltransferase [Burkholderiaceae bacterium]